MWSFYLNGGIEAVLEHLCRDGFQCQMPDGSLRTWHTIVKSINHVEGIFQKQDGDAASRQVLQIFPNEIVSISYYAPDSEQPYLTYRCRREAHDIAHVERTRAEEIAFDSPVIVTSRNDVWDVTSYCIPEAGWEVTLAYNEKGLLVREEVCAPDGNGVLEYEWDEEGVLILQRLIENEVSNK